MTSVVEQTETNPVIAAGGGEADLAPAKAAEPVTPADPPVEAASEAAGAVNGAPQEAPTADAAQAVVPQAAKVAPSAAAELQQATVPVAQGSWPPQAAATQPAQHAYSASAMISGAPSATSRTNGATNGHAYAQSAEAAAAVHAQAVPAAGESARLSGKCNKWLDHGYGFITASDGGNYFVHQTQIHAQGFRSLQVGEDVEFELEMGEKGKLTAVRVTGPGGVYVRGGSHSRRGRGGHRGGYRGYRGAMASTYNPQQMYAGYTGQMMDQYNATYAAAYGAQAYAAASYGAAATGYAQYQTSDAQQGDQQQQSGYGTAAASYGQQSAGNGSTNRYQPY